MIKMIKVMKGKIKKPSNSWEEYLNGKTLILCTGLVETLNLLGIEGEEELDDLCEHVWNAHEEQGHYTLEDFKEAVKLGNDGFGFDKNNIEIIEVLSEVQIERDRYSQN